MTNLSGANLNNGSAVGPQGEGMDSPSSFPAYPAYKDSGVEWLGGLPQHWRFGCLKHALIELISGGTPESSNPAYWADGDGVPWVAISDMTKGLVINDTAKTITEDGLRSKGLRVIPAGGLLYSIYASIGKVAVLGLSAVTNQAILGLVVNGAVADQQFVRWWLVSLEGWVKTISSSNTQDNLNAEKVRNLPLAFPSLTEQTQIARFLDHETARIDALIEEQERLIELLKEKRQAVISHAVTKGFDPTVPMKDSGVEWLGEVPAHWEVIALKRLARKITDGEHISPQFTDEGMPFLSAKNIRDRVVEYNVEKYVSLEDGLRFRRRCNPEINDVLIVSRGATIGRVGLVEQEVIFCLLGSVILLKAKSDITDPVFIYYMLNQNSAQEQFQLASQASAQQAIYLVDVAELSVVLPPLAEQIKIREILEVLVGEVNNLIDVANDAIALMQERRSALISAAVTGKIDVRGWQAPASTQAPELAVVEAN